MRRKMASLPVELKKLSKDITVTVTIRMTPEFRIRKAIAKWLIRLGINILGCRVVIDDESSEA